MHEDEPVTMRTTGGRPPYRRGPSGFWIFLVLGMFAILFFVVIGALGSLGTLLSPPATGDFREMLVEGDPGADDRLLLLPITGMILDGEAGMLGEAVTSPWRVRKILDAARENRSIRGVLLEVNSPGGGVTASDLIYEEVRRYKLDTGQPVVAYFKDVAASGGYYVAMAADEIVAHPTTITGSIGVILRLVNYGELFEKVGLRDVTITPEDTPMKDMGSPTRPMTDEEQERFESIVTEMYERFVDVVDQGRGKLDRDAVGRLADGSIYSARQARDGGLVDTLGSRRDALAELRERADLEDAALVTYRQPPTLLETLLMKASPGRTIERRLDEALARLRPSGSGLMYLWPGWSPN